MDEVEALLGTNRWIMKKWGLVLLLVNDALGEMGVYICVCRFKREKGVSGE